MKELNKLQSSHYKNVSTDPLSTIWGPLCNVHSVEFRWVACTCVNTCSYIYNIYIYIFIFIYLFI